MIGRGILAGALAVALAAGPGTAAKAGAGAGTHAGTGMGASTAAGAVAREPTRCQPDRGVMEVGESWAQRRLAFTSVWPLTRGQGVTVALIDSGVDTRHPQLKVAKSIDLTGTTLLDCVGHGTALAGIIAAAEDKNIPFVGVAPGVRLISIKQANEGQDGDVAVLAKGIVQAADLGAQVINISIETTDQPDLKAAVEYALAKDCVIVAAAGNRRGNGITTPSYPAAYPGVLSVGAAGPDGKRTDFSNASTPVSVLAPGTNITSTWPGLAYRPDLDGTSFSVAFVSGVAALVRAYRPELDNVRVRRRIEITADGASGTGTGAGMVNPLLAVTEILPSEVVAIAPRQPTALPSGIVSKAPPPDQEAIDVSVGVAVIAVGAAALVAAAGVVIPLGRRRGWRPGRTTVPGDGKA